MSGDTRAIINPKQSRAIRMSFACPEINAGCTTPTQSNNAVETGVMTPVSFFVSVLLAALLPVVRVCLVVVLVCRLTGLATLNGLVGLTASRACTAGQGV
jgi:hypothetical protein